MKTFRSQSQPEQRGALSSLSSLSSSAMSPLSTASITLAVLFILTIPACTSKSEALFRMKYHVLFALKSFLTVPIFTLQTSDIIGELCILMLVQKSKVSYIKYWLLFFLHPLLHLVSQLHPRRERGVVMSAELQGPGGIESRGYFLYRPRNGRRSLEYE
uniref:Neuromedin U C-terminal domain-containing protein n=1 Tax=Fundulus heteroclitus TaxID=8078 RepID=A0A3Q2QNN2_FUNHE